MVAGRATLGGGGRGVSIRCQLARPAPSLTGSDVAREGRIMIRSKLEAMWLLSVMLVAGCLAALDPR
jgi:hypothetical protein